MKRAVDGRQVKGAPMNRSNTNPTMQNKNQNHDNSLEEFLMFDTETEANGIKQENDADDTEDLMLVDFEVNGQKISAKMSTSMVQFLNENEALRQQLVEKLLSDSSGNSGEHVIIKEEPASMDDEVTEEVQEPPVAEPTYKTTPTSSGQSGPHVRTASVATRGYRQPFGTNRGRNVRTLVERTYPGTSVGQVNKLPARNGDNFKWDNRSTPALIEAYGTTINKFKGPRVRQKWPFIGKQLRALGFQVTDTGCENQFESLKTSYIVRKKHNSQGAKFPPWEYFEMMEQVLTAETPIKINSAHIGSTPIVSHVSNSSANELDDGLSDSSGNLSSDLDDLEKELEPSKKRQKLDTVGGGALDLFRRTYLRVEKKKLKEMRMMRREQNRLQAERNLLLSSIADLLRKK